MDIYAGGIANLTEARFFSSREVSMLGIEIDNERITPETFVEIKNWLEGPLVVAEIWKLDISKYDNLLSELDTDYALVSVEQLALLKDSSFSKIVYLTDEKALSNTTILLDADSIVVSNQCWKNASKAIEKLAQTQEVYLEMIDLKEQKNLPLGISAVYIKAEGEEKTGLKDFSKLSEILDAIEGEA